MEIVVSTQDTYRPLIWRLHTVMSERGIRTATELLRRLQPYGVEITSAQMSRIVAKMPARLNLSILEALMSALDCEASELLRRGPPRPLTDRAGGSAPGNTKSATPAAPPVRKSPKAAVRPVPPNVLGPSVRSLVTRTKREPGR